MARNINMVKGKTYMTGGERQSLYKSMISDCTEEDRQKFRSQKPWHLVVAEREKEKMK